MWFNSTLRQTPAKTFDQQIRQRDRLASRAPHQRHCSGSLQHSPSLPVRDPGKDVPRKQRQFHGYAGTIAPLPIHLVQGKKTFNTSVIEVPRNRLFVPRAGVHGKPLRHTIRFPLRRRLWLALLARIERFLQSSAVLTWVRCFPQYMLTPENRLQTCLLTRLRTTSPTLALERELERRNICISVVVRVGGSKKTHCNNYSSDLLTKCNRAPSPLLSC